MDDTVSSSGGVEVLTLFAIPKPFVGHTGLIQRNAIMSWTHLHPRPEILLFGNDRGTGEIAAEFQLRHMPHLECSEFGTPLMSDMFAQAQKVGTRELFCHVNADIVLTSLLYRAIELLQEQCGTFLMFSTPWNLRIEHEINFSAGWEDRLRDWIRDSGQAPKPVGVDTFVFPRGFYNQLPPFAVGRMAQDNWLLYRACRGRFPAVDGSRFALTVHQAHEGSTHYGDPGRNAEFERNRLLAGWWARSFVADDLPYVLTEDGKLQKKSFANLLGRRFRAVSSPGVNHILNRTYRVRRKLGLYRSNGQSKRP